MHYRSYIRFINAHSKSVGTYNYPDLVPDPLVLFIASDFLIKARMIIIR